MQFDLNLNHLTLPEIMDFNALQRFGLNLDHHSLSLANARTRMAMNHVSG